MDTPDFNDALQRIKGDEGNALLAKFLQEKQEEEIAGGGNRAYKLLGFGSDTCIFATIILLRLDGQAKLYLNSLMQLCSGLYWRFSADIRQKR